MSGEEVAVLDSGICRNMKAPVGDMDTRGGGNASSMGVVGLTGQHWRAERKGQLAVNSKLPDFREQSDLPPSRGLAANTDSYSFFFFFFNLFLVVLGSSLLWGLLPVAVSLVAENRLLGTWAPVVSARG